MSTSHELAVFADKECHDAGHVVWAAEPVERSLLLQLCQLLLAPAVLVSLCLDDACVDGVNADIERAELFSGSKGDTAESKLAGTVRDEVGEPAETGDGGSDYDGAATRGGLHGCSSVLDA